MESPEPLISSTVNGSLVVVLEGLARGAADAGLPQESADMFVRQSLLGTVLLMQDVEDSPAVVKDRVASPGGTTIAGLAALEDSGVRGIMIGAVHQAVLGDGEGRDK